MESVGLITQPKLRVEKFYIPDSKETFYFSNPPVRVWNANFMDKTEDELLENLKKYIEKIV